MSLSEIAVARFDKGFSCAQAVFSTFAEQDGIDEGMACRIAAGFGGGMGRQGGTCGAVTGAYIVLGLKYGGADKEAKEKTYELVREFARRFEAANGSSLCRQLLGYDINTPEGHKHAREVCPGFVRSATEIVEQLLTQP